MASKKTIDFTNVQEGGLFNKRRIPAGDYLAYVSKVEDAESKADGIFQYLFTIKLRNKHVASSFPYYCKLQENQLWKLRNLFVAAGINIPKKRLSLDPGKVLNRTIGVSVEDDSYDGKDQSTIGAIFPASDLQQGGDSTPEGSITEEDEPEEEEETAVVVDDEEEEEESDQFETMDRVALKAFIKSQDATARFVKSQSDDDLRVVARSFTVNLDEEEEEEEEPPPPPVKKPVSKAPAKKRVRKPVSEDDDLDIEDL